MIKSKHFVTLFTYLSLLGFLGFVYDKKLAYFFLSYTVAIFIKIIASFSDKKKQGYAVYYTTLHLSLLNPRSVLILFKQLAGQVYILSRYKKKLNHPPLLKANYILPFKGTWKVFAGGNKKEQSHSWQLYNQRYALDLVITDEQNRAYEGQGELLEDYYCYSKVIISPADGIVVDTRNDVNDYHHPGNLSIDWKTKDIRGNYVIIEHKSDEFSFLAHLKKGSILVKNGESVKQGQPIGLSGNSGHSTMPHLHFQIQNGKSTWLSMGLPLQFNNIIIDSVMDPGKHAIETNQWVSNADVR